ncbi:DUF6000 family protein [Actinoallomurus purpureus]|uniref:DUF6000 family protein n=1 Tax=Actinoallomurus purpureus TaxID=478114 RepID=UPI00355641F9
MAAAPPLLPAGCPARRGDQPAARNSTAWPGRRGSPRAFALAHFGQHRDAALLARALVHRLPTPEPLYEQNFVIGALLYLVSCARASFAGDNSMPQTLDCGCQPGCYAYNASIQQGSVITVTPRPRACEAERFYVAS